MISIIVPIYNGKKYLKSVIKSIHKQTYTNYEIIVIDDGSTDGIDSNYIENIDKSILFYSKNNEGLGKTRNLGITLAKGDYIFFLDCDDTLPNRALELLRNAINRNDFSIGLCKRQFLNHHSNVYKEEIWKKNLYKKEINKYNFIIDTIATNKLYKKNFLLENNITFSKGLYEDKLFVLKLFEHSNHFTFINNIVYHWNIHHASSSITNSLTIDNLQERMKANEECLSYTKDKKLKYILVKNIIKHDFKIYINKVSLYSNEELLSFYAIYKNFIQKYKNYINNNDYFVDRIIIENIENKNLIIKEFKNISRENSTRNIFIKIKKYMRYSYYYLKAKLL